MIRYRLSERVKVQRQLEEAMAADLAADSLERQLKARQQREAEEAEENGTGDTALMLQGAHREGVSSPTAEVDDVRNTNQGSFHHDFFQRQAAGFEPLQQEHNTNGPHGNRPISAMSANSGNFGLLDSLFPTRPGTSMSLMSTSDNVHPSSNLVPPPPRPASSMSVSGGPLNTRLVSLPPRPTTGGAMAHQQNNTCTTTTADTRRPLSVDDIVVRKNKEWCSTYQDLVAQQEVEIWGKVEKKSVDIYAPYRPWKEGSKEDFDNRMIAATVDSTKYRLELRRMELQDELQATTEEADRLEKANSEISASTEQRATNYASAQLAELEDLRRVEAEAAADVAASEAYFKPKLSANAAALLLLKKAKATPSRVSIRRAVGSSSSSSSPSVRKQQKENFSGKVLEDSGGNGGPSSPGSVQLRATNLDLDAHVLGKGSWIKQNRLRDERKVWTPGTAQLRSAVSEWQIPEEHAPWVSSHPCVIRRDDGVTDYIAPSRSIIAATCDSTENQEKQHQAMMVEMGVMRRQLSNDCELIEEPNTRRRIQAAEQVYWYHSIFLQCTKVVMPCLKTIEFGLKRQERAAWSVLTSLFETRKLVIEAKQMTTPYVMEHRPLTRRHVNQELSAVALVNVETGGEASKDRLHLMERNRQEVATAEEARLILRAESDRHQERLREGSRQEWRQQATWRAELTKTQQEKLKWKEQRRIKRGELREIGRRMQERQPQPADGSRTTTPLMSEEGGSQMRLHELRTTPNKNIQLPPRSTAGSSALQFLEQRGSSLEDSVGVETRNTPAAPPLHLGDDESTATSLKQRIEYLEWSISSCEQREEDLKKKLGVV